MMGECLLHFPIDEVEKRDHRAGLSRSSKQKGKLYYSCILARYERIIRVRAFDGTPPLSRKRERRRSAEKSNANHIFPTHS